MFLLLEEYRYCQLFTPNMDVIIPKPLSTRAEDCCGRGKTGNRRGHVALISSFEQLAVCLQISVDSGE